MNRIVVCMSGIILSVLINTGMSRAKDIELLKKDLGILQMSNLEMKQQMDTKVFLTKRQPLFLETEYGLVMNQVRILESYSGTNMELQLQSAQDTEDIAEHYEATAYKGVSGLKVKIIVDKFSGETDMGAVLDDIHLLEKNTDFLASEIIKDNNSLIVKGEIYGL